jgi:hypothetical protein
MIVMGAATHGLQMQRFIATVPIRVAMSAPCTVVLVKQAVPFDHLGARPEAAAVKRAPVRSRRSGVWRGRGYLWE